MSVHWKHIVILYIMNIMKTYCDLKVISVIRTIGADSRKFLHMWLSLVIKI